MQNQTAAQPSPHFKDASARQKIPPLGYNGEISEMVEKGMLFPPAVALHCGNLKLSRQFTFHDSIHIIVGCLHETHPHLIVDKNYQADNWAEAYVGSMEYYSENHTWGRKQFISNVQSYAENFIFAENKSRVVAWMLSPSSGKSIMELKALEQRPLYEMVRAAGIGIEYNKNQYFERGEFFTITSPDHGRFKISRSGIEFPNGFSGQKELISFHVPSNDEAGEMFDALEPALDFIRRKIKLEYGGMAHNRDGRILRDVAVGEIVERINEGKRASPQQRAVAGRDVPPVAVSPAP